MSSISDDIINGLDKSTDFTDKLSKLVHLPTNKIKSLTEPLGLKDYMSLTKAVDEEDPEGARRILLTGFNKLDPAIQKLIDTERKVMAIRVDDEEFWDVGTADAFWASLNKSHSLIEKI